MAAFKYKAISRDGANVSGVVEAYDEFEAVARIKETCDIVLSIAEAAERTSILSMEIGSGKIKLKSLALLCSQFAIILKAGLPVVRAVELIAAQTADQQLKKLLNQVAGDVAAGYGLAQSFENKGAKRLPTTFIETLRAGEEAGTLEVAFQKLFTYYDKAHKVKSKVRSAMMYPMFLCVLAVGVVAFIMAFVMPVFTDMFAEMGNELPALTQGLIGFTEFCGKYWPGILGAVVLIAILLKLYGNTEAGRLRFARLQLQLPALGKVALMRGASQLANTMGTMLSAGLPVIRAVSATARTLDNYLMSQRLGSAVAGLEEGRRLGDCLRACECFPDMLIEMAAVGEESGSLEETLETIGTYYDSEVEAATQKALSMIQPVITVALGVVIGIIVIALYLPMFSMYDGMA